MSRPWQARSLTVLMNFRVRSISVVIQRCLLGMPKTLRSTGMSHARCQALNTAPCNHYFIQCWSQWKLDQRLVRADLQTESLRGIPSTSWAASPRAWTKLELFKLPDTKSWHLSRLQHEMFQKVFQFALLPQSEEGIRGSRWKKEPVGKRGWSLTSGQLWWIV